MDGEKFDDIIKRLSAIRLTRGNTLRGLAGGALAALTGAVVAEDETDAKNKHKGGHAAHKDGGGGGHKGHNKNKHHKDNHQAHSAGKHGKKKKKKNNSQATSVPPEGCPGKGAKICHCTPSTTNSVCNVVGNGTGHSGSGHIDDCCCGSQGCDCTAGGNDCCLRGLTCSNSGQCCKGSNPQVCCGGNGGEGSGLCQSCCNTGQTCATNSECCQGCCNGGNGTAGSGTCGACPTTTTTEAPTTTTTTTTCGPNCAGKECGSDGCGDNNNCGTCPDNLTCNANGQCECTTGPICGTGDNRVCCPNSTDVCNGDVCCSPSCAGKECGSDGCGDNNNCGTCPDNLTCNNSGICECTTGPICGSGDNRICCPVASNVCFQDACCAPTTCESQGKVCGASDDGCGNPLDCGTCPDNLTCAADQKSCECTTGTICGSGKDRVCCPNQTDICDPNNQCCAPTTCADQGLVCGPSTDGCGNPLDCGTCPDNLTCAADQKSCECTTGPICGTGNNRVCCASNSNVCFNDQCCAPTTCAAEGKVCGTISDGCGTELTCGTCPDNLTCNADQTGCECTTGPICGTGDNRVCCANSTDVCNGDVCCSPVSPCTGNNCGSVQDNCGVARTCECASGTAECVSGVCVEPTTTTTTTQAPTTTTTTTAPPAICPPVDGKDRVQCCDDPTRKKKPGFKCCPASASPCGFSSSGEACCGGLPSTGKACKPPGSANPPGGICPAGSSQRKRKSHHGKH